MMVLVAISACKGDAYGDVFVNRKPVTFHVSADNGNPISNVEVKAEELDSFDKPMITWFLTPPSLLGPIR